jgi:hypothetical protein
VCVRVLQNYLISLFCSVTEVAGSERLLSEVAQTNIPSLSPNTRKALIRTLVTIGAATDVPEHRQNMYKVVSYLLSLFCTFCQF